MALPNFINTVASEPSLARWTSLINNQPQPFPAVFYGDTKLMNWVFHNNGTVETFSGGTGYSLKVTLGNVDAGPTGGTYTLTCGEETEAIAWDADAAAVASALNGLQTVINFGGVNVLGVFPNFRIYSNEVGVVTAITTDASLLSPDSSIAADVLTTGSVSARQQTLLALRRGLITQQTNWTPITGPAGWTGSLAMNSEAAAALLAEFGEVVGGYLQAETQLTAEVIKDSDSTVEAYYQTTVLFRGKNSDFSTTTLPPSPPYALGDILYGNAQGGLSKLPGNTSGTLKVLTQTGDGVNSAAPSWQAETSLGVTSVGLSLPSDLFTVSGSPVTSTGTLTGTLKTQVKNTLWAGPTTGADANPAFRSLVLADLPALTTGSFVLTGNGAGGFTNTDLTYSTPTLSVPDAFNISSAGSILLTSTANSSINLLPGGTGNVGIGIANPSGGPRLAIISSSAATTPTLTTFVGSSDSLAFYGQATTAGISGVFAGTANQRPTITFTKTGGTLALPTALVDGDQIANIAFRGYDGSAVGQTFGIIASVDGTVGASGSGLVPTKIILRVADTTGSVTDGLVIRSTGGTDWTSRQPASVATSPGTSPGNVFNFNSPAVGGNTTIATTGIGGVGGAVFWQTGAGGTANSATTSSTGGAGGLWRVAVGNGGASNVSGGAISIGGKGGGIQTNTGTGGASSTTNGTNTGGAGGDWLITSGNGGASTNGTANTGGAGGAITITSGNGGAGATAAGNSGTITINTGTSGAGGTVGSIILKAGGVTALTIGATGTSTFALAATFSSTVSAAGATITSTNVLNFGATALGNIGVSADTTAGILQIKSPTSGTITLTTANALGLTVSGGASCVLTGGAGSMTIVGGTGASRTVTIQTTTSGSTATTALTLSATQTATFASTIATADPQNGAGAWLLGKVRTGAGLLISATTGLQVKVDGTLYTLAVLSTNP